MKKSIVFEGVAVTLLIFLSFLMLAMLLSGAEKQAPGIGEIRYTLAGSGDTLYAFSGDNVSAIGPDGALLWTFTAPAQWSIYDYGLYTEQDPYTRQYLISTGRPIVSENNGILYVCMGPAGDNASTPLMDGAVVAISGGKKLWELPFKSHNGDGYFQPYSDAAVYARGGRVYVFHDYNETVMDENGTVLWTIGNISTPAAVDEQGFVYAVRSPGPASGSLKFPFDVYVPDHREPTTIIDAYYPNGTLYWENYTKTPLVLQSLGGTLPLYDNGMIYAPMYDGITAFYPNGTARWTKTFDSEDFTFEWPFDPDNLTAEQQKDIKLFERLYSTTSPEHVLQKQNGIKLTLELYDPMPFDSDGNVYLQCISHIPVPDIDSPILCLLTIGPDGREISRDYRWQYTYTAAKDGIGYSTGKILPTGPRPMIMYVYAQNITDLTPGILHATNFSTGIELWNYTFPVNDSKVVVLDRESTRTLLGSYMAQRAIEDAALNESQRPISSYGPIRPESRLSVHPGDGLVYVSFQSMNYEDPIILGKSKCAYAGGIYAFGTNGTLLWQKQMLPFDSMQVTQNGTVFYRTPDGKIGVTGAGIAAGFTLTAILYLFLRFLCIGAVARAKARLDKNDNRNRVLDFIVKNPGSSLYDIARGTSVNLGTVRYHLFILGINHKIVASQTDGKYVRYFTNSNSYSKDEQLILSLMRRDAMGRMLGLMLKRPGISNVEIARELGIKESVVSRCMKELSDKGVIAREPDGRGCSVDEAHREHVARAVRRIYGE